MLSVESARSRIGILRRYVYLDNASSGPLPDPVAYAVKSFVEEWASEGEPWEDGVLAEVECRRLFSQLVNASPEEVALLPGVTYGLAVILSSLRLKRGSNIVVSSLNFPTSILIARSMASRGLVREVRVAEARNGSVDVGVYERLVDDNTSIVMVDYVGWLSGHVENLGELARIAHEHGAILVSDAFHAVGVLPVDVKSLDVDVLMTGSYKWLMSIHGVALAYIRGELLEELQPPYAGWMAVEDSVAQRLTRGEPVFERPIDTSKLNLARGALKLEWGTLPLIAVVALRESLKFIIEHRAPELYYNHTWRVADRIAEGLEDLGYKLYTPRDNHSAIVTFRHEKPLKLAEDLEKKGIKVASRPKLVRVSPHFYNTIEDAEKLLESLKELRSKI
jgi:selenocysteine lyase/cysteine desulfurase